MADVASAATLPTEDEFFGSAPSAPSASTDVAPAPDVTSPAPSDDITSHVDALIAQESGGNPNAVGDSGLALGLGQMHPEVRRAYGVTPNSTPDEQKSAITKYFTDLYNKHGKNADDALAEYHLGATNYERDRNSPDTQKYLETHRAKLGKSGATSTSATAETPSEPPTEDEFFSGVSSPTSSTTQTTTSKSVGDVTSPAPSMRSMSVEDAGREINRGFGLDDNHFSGRYLAALGKPATDALQDFYEALTTRSDPTSVGDQVTQFLKAAHPLGIPAEAVAEVALQASRDMGFSPDAQATVGTLAGILMGFKTPTGLGEGEAPKVAPKAPTGVASGIESDLARGATEASDVAATAAKAVEPSEEAAAKARAALNPPRPLAEPIPGPPEPPVTPEEAGKTLQSATKRGAEGLKADVQAGYDDISHAASDLSMSAKDTESLSANLKNLREQLGAEYKEPTEAEFLKNPDAKAKWEGGLITGEQKKVIDDIEEVLASGESPSYPQMEELKVLLDSVIPGRTPVGAPPKVARMYQFKWDFRKMMRNVLESADPDLAKQFDSLNARWAKEVLPNSRLVDKLAKLDPRLAFVRVFGNGKSEANAAKTLEALKLTTPDDIDTFRRGFTSMMMKTDAEGKLDPRALLKHWDDLNTSIRDHFATPGAKDFFESIRRDIGAAERGAQWASAAEKEASKATAAAGKAAPKVAAPETPKLARLTARGLQIAAGTMIGKAVGHELAGAMVGTVLPVDELAKALANPKLANLLARAAKTPLNSAIVPTLYQQMKKNGLIGNDDNEES